MGKRLRYLVFLGVFLGVICQVQGQITGAHPPEPMSARDVPGSECAGESNGSGPSVPVGLCLPINNYLFPLLISGVALGAAGLSYIQQKEVKRAAA